MGLPAVGSARCRRHEPGRVQGMSLIKRHLEDLAESLRPTLERAGGFSALLAAHE